eukprot:gene7841-9350_t
MLEYDNMEGMMMYAQIGRRRVRSMSGYFKVGRMEVVRVIRVDKEKGPPEPTGAYALHIRTGYIDLTRREIENEDRVKCVERYNKAVAVRDVLSHVAKRNNMRLEDMYSKVGWLLYAKFGHAYDAFQRVLNTTVEEEPTNIFADLNVSAELKEDLIMQIMEMDHEPASVKLATEVFSDDSEAVTVVENDHVE